MAEICDRVKALRERDAADLERARIGDLSVGAQFNTRTVELLEDLRALRAAAMQLQTATTPELGQDRSKDERQLAAKQRLEASDLLVWAQAEYELRAKERLELDALEQTAQNGDVRKTRPNRLDRLAAADLVRLARESQLPVSEDGDVVRIIVGSETLVVSGGRLQVESV
jgi:hypothetical protein